ncbi:hypothetical protein PsYK624_163860 [Phanerochaete sordida]|uniref:Uncharacterized protein n=1 Tax=Phanerochaete sordida TaxID=48140 RepID=A0A9P3LM18_9APHY|nr:hypothetical protein PsYK624_163860 [Phanerochaete sordida]
MAIDISSDFFAVDELIQVIYQGSLKFLVLSRATRTAWTLHVALDKTPRWWAGQWTPHDVEAFLGSRREPEDVEALADSLGEMFTKGELHVGDWSDDAGAQINLTLGPTAPRPVRISLTELAPADAAAFATSMFSLIATNAKEYKCRMCPAPYDLTSTSSASDAPAPVATSSSAVAPPPAAAPPSPAKAYMPYRTAAEKRKASQSPVESTKSLPGTPQKPKKTEDMKVAQLERALADEKRKHSAHHGRTSGPVSELDPSIERLIQEETAKAVKKLPRRGPGASLANPSQKARKYQAVEFEDSD